MCMYAHTPYITRHDMEKSCCAVMEGLQYKFLYFQNIIFQTVNQMICSDNIMNKRIFLVW